jgi:hypothetical protein
MPGSTTKYAIPYSDGGDAMGTVDDTMQSMAERIDLLMGETGTKNITPSAPDTDTSVRVDYARDYSAVGAPFPMVQINESIATANQAVVWASAADATGFTLNIRASTTTIRSVRWTCRR